MSSQFFYVQLNFRPKIGADRMPLIKHHEAVVEVPKDLVQRRQSEITSENSREKVIVLELARRAALGTFPTLTERLIGLYDEDPPIWCADQHGSSDRTLRAELQSALNPVVALPVLQTRTDFPEVGKEIVADGITQVFRSRRAAGSELRPDRPLHHLHVAIAPLLYALVEIDEPLAQFDVFHIASIQGD